MSEVRRFRATVCNRPADSDKPGPSIVFDFRGTDEQACAFAALELFATAEPEAIRVEEIDEAKAAPLMPLAGRKGIAAEAVALRTALINGPSLFLVSKCDELRARICLAGETPPEFPLALNGGHLVRRHALELIGLGDDADSPAVSELALQAQEWLSAVVRQFDISDAGVDPAGTTPVETPVAASKLLVTWHEICHAVERTNDESSRNLIRRFSDACDGPIHIAGRGKQPKPVDRDHLVKWWNGLSERQQHATELDEELAANVEGSIGDGARYNYGRSGEVVPEIGGSVKKRRQV